ncbi:probable receptor-like serine/threonine-protein kinase At4g34500 [Papaver somniferum]|uniref:probable receptor-like serine/threonine-protein kinase At4g34500 n=1 Tax=Papaver somniferum TaxID=3469 RepID=UPI000E6F4B60|nr:probable receptor-like serine/threonine-protein kinase At4g34500 [Papaver somniferum]
MKNSTEAKHYIGNGIRRSEDTLAHKLSARTSVFSIRLYVLIGVCVGLLVLAVLLLIFLCCFRRKSIKRRMRIKHCSGSTPMISKEILEILDEGIRLKESNEFIDCEKNEVMVQQHHNKVMKNGSLGSLLSGGSSHESSSSGSSSVEVPDLGWGRWYTLRELETATDGFSDENVIGEGGYGIVYRGVLPDSSVIAVKNLLNKKGQAEKEFKIEVEAIGKVKHKNLVGLIGYCAEGAQRMLIFEYMDNGNLEQWLHSDEGPVSPLTWDIRMQIAVGTAKGLAYLHEGLEPKVVHRDVKSSNILLDKKWNPKVSDFGLAKLLGSDASYVTTRVMGTFGCVAPDYASTGMLNEASDVYSFGVLLMELISGRTPVDYARPAGEVNLVEWFRGLVASRRGEEVVDPRIEIQPAPRALKRLQLICLRCIDLDASKRPKMGQVVHMLEAEEFPYRSESRLAAQRDAISPSNSASPTAIARIALAPVETAER